MGFTLEDFLQDIDAVNIFDKLYSTNIVDVFKNYYNSPQDRYSNFLKNRIKIGTLPTDVSTNDEPFEIVYSLAYQYLYASDSSIQSTLSSLLANIVKVDYNPQVWADPVATAFATKMGTLILSEKI